MEHMFMSRGTVFSWMGTDVHYSIDVLVYSDASAKAAAVYCMVCIFATGLFA